MRYRIEVRTCTDGFNWTNWEDSDQYYYYADSEEDALDQFMTANEENFRWIDGLTVEDRGKWIEMHYTQKDDYGRTWEVEDDYRAIEDPEEV